ncbi:acyltransferase [Duganella sp. BJB488]|uniref:acyltransferase family protein n=1 Tax=unclassified Duganella TaxID=2636909 RepID=UPI000E351C7D|nr:MULTISPECIES: acyltransferase [unclassified Duganella]RFP26195.1 acyltransferase [Duganella sp. BJB489]RFP28065.1 acyltransferase [Duganella sp. BJB488]RFP37126.1 acyltransferase [Duganella sp. BJB480]
MNQEKNLHWVQLLRGIAAVLVVLTHARYQLLDTPAWPLAEQLLTPGAMGVDLFFLISGFIMYYSTAGAAGGPAEAARFLIKRFARVWPAYAIATLAFAYVSYGVEYFHVAANRLAFWHTLGMLPFDPRQAPYFGLTLVVAWTLEFEMYFYLIFAASMLFKRLRWVALVGWVALTVLVLPYAERGFNLSVEGGPVYPVGYLSIVTSPFVLEFLIGVLIGWLYSLPWLRVRSRQLAWNMLALGVTFALWAAYSGAVNTHGPSHYGWPLALMVLAMALASKTVQIRVPALFLWLGSISYSLYLTHLITGALLQHRLMAKGLDPLWHTWPSVMLTTVCSVAMAALSHRYLEQGLSNLVRDGLLKLLPARPAPQAAPAPVPAARRA